MKYKVKFRITDDNGEQKKLAMNLEEGGKFVFGQKSIELRAELGTLEVRGGELWIVLTGVPGMTVNGNPVKQTALRPGDLLQGQGYSVEFLELPHRPVNTETQFLDVSKLTEKAQPKVETEKHEPTRVQARPAPAKIVTEATKVQIRPSQRASEAVKHESTKVQTRRPEPAAAPLPEQGAAFKDTTGEIPTSAAEASLPQDPSQSYLGSSKTGFTRRTQFTQSNPETDSLPYQAEGTQMTRFTGLSRARTDFTMSLGMVVFLSAIAGGINKGFPVGFAILGGVTLVFAVSGLMHALRERLQLSAQFGDYIHFWGYASIAAIPVSVSFAHSRVLGLTVMGIVSAGIFYGMWHRFKPSTQPFAFFVTALSAVCTGSLYGYFQHLDASGGDAPVLVAESETTAGEPAERSPAGTDPEQPVQQAAAPAPAAVAPVQPQQPVQLQQPIQQAQAPVQQQPAASVPAQTAPVQAQAQPENPNRVVDRMSVPDPLASEQFFRAVREGNLRVVREMIQRKAVDPNFTLEKGNTALMHAAAYGHLGVVKHLVSLRVNINAQDPNGTTALMWAVYRNHREVARFLVDRGADLTLRRDDGDRAADIARRWNRLDIAAIFEAKDPALATKKKPDSKRAPAAQPKKKKQQTYPAKEDFTKIRSIPRNR